MLTKISPKEAHTRYTQGKARFIDIRSADEFSNMSITDSLLAPLSVISLQNLKSHVDNDKEVIFLCRSGNRVLNASSILETLIPDAYILEGGIEAWEKENLPLRKKINSTIPLERQILISAGSMVTIGVIGSLFWPPALFLAGFVGAGLVFAGISGFCGLGILLSKMPWNNR